VRSRARDDARRANIAPSSLDDGGMARARRAVNVNSEGNYEDHRACSFCVRYVLYLPTDH
jgi:hypothetical protein